jgi:ferredoxin
MGQGAAYLPRSQFQTLLDTLKDAGYRCIGPQVKDRTILFDTIEDADSLPQGMAEEQGPGLYRLISGTSKRNFSWANGPQALKPLLFSPEEKLWSVGRDDEGHMHFTTVVSESEHIAVIGVRACDLAALRLQDQHFLEGEYVDPYYASRRHGLFLVAVNCSHPASTCFCVSTGDGPETSLGYDLTLSELDDGFIIQYGSERGRVIHDRLDLGDVTPAMRKAADAEMQQSRASQQRTLPSRNLREDLFANLEHPRWDDVAERCLSCGNCTSVCPTCFCHAEMERPYLDGDSSEHVRQWDSCFTQGHSYIHGMTIRANTRLRYRQWLTHKLGYWHDQYGRSGCVGCGRCIAWCPVGIDITEEAANICTREIASDAS